MHDTQFDRRLSIAPMMDHTDRHFRYFMRLLSPHVVLYTEMITTGALLHGDRDRFLKYNDVEHPLALQLGGSKPEELAECAVIAETAGYDEVNLNVGCPSDRVQNGQFGACLMANAALVAECVHAMQSRVTIPVTVKTRIGIDEQDDYAFLHNFIESVKQSGCRVFIIHARKAILSGLSPKQNREIPPLIYERVYQLKQTFPDLQVIINGGFTQQQDITRQYQHVDGVMIGRAAYQNPYLLAQLEQVIFDQQFSVPSRSTIFEQYCQYMQQQMQQGERIKNMSRHIIGLYQGQPGAKRFRRALSQAMPGTEQDKLELLDDALALMSGIS